MGTNNPESTYALVTVSSRTVIFLLHSPMVASLHSGQYLILVR